MFDSGKDLLVVCLKPPCFVTLTIFQVNTHTCQRDKIKSDEKGKFN